jgi:D-serine deaminase-like pyridoxal phosphate-dependent protein
MYDGRIDERVAELRRWPITADEKGFGGPSHRSPVTAELLAAERPSADGLLSSPRVLLRGDALDRNLDAMAKYCAAHGAELFPHGKTTMAPQIFARQLRAGAAGMTAATVQQVRLYRGFGVRAVLLANEVVDEAGISWLARELRADPDFGLMCYVDSVAGVERLDTILAREGFGGRLRVLVELGHGAGRTGCRGLAEALAVAAAAKRSRRLTVAGVAGFEGSIDAGTVDATVEAARRFCEGLGELAAALLDAGGVEDRPIVSAGGSAYFDAVVDALGGRSGWRLILRSGCYALHDNGLYSRVSPFVRGSAPTPGLEPALEVWAPVLSRPEAGTAVVGAGRRDLSFDAGMPVLLGARTPDGTGTGTEGCTVEKLFDQHAVVSVPEASALGPGDEIRLGISHPCTTMDKWRWLPVVDADNRVIDAVRTFF